MGEKITYFTRAENDYQYYNQDIINGRVGDTLCVNAQSICERYLKHIINSFCCDIPKKVMRTHSLRVLRNFIQGNLPDFNVDWKTVMKADGFYFTARYPGDDAIEVTKDDVEESWMAVNEIRTAVIWYCDNHIVDNVKRETDDIIHEIHVF